MEKEFISHISKNGEGQTVKEHCEGVAAMARYILEKVNLGNSGFLLGLIHDAGKCTDDFNTYIKNAHIGERVQRGSVIHTFAAVSYLINRYHDKPDITSELLSIAAGCHHGLFDCFDEDGNCGFEHRVRKQPEYDKTAINNFFEMVCSESEIDKYKEESDKEIDKIIKIIDQKNKEKKDSFFYLAMLSRLMTSALIDADRTDTANFMSGIAGNKNTYSNTRLWGKCLSKFDSYISKLSNDSAIQKVRSALSNECYKMASQSGGLYRLNIPTGGGKTLTSLRFALKHAKDNNKERIFFISPLLSILEQNADEIRKAIDNNEIILEHHSDIVFENEHTAEYRQYESLCETWDSPIIITTLVQFLNTLFSSKTSSIRRFHTYINSIIVIDEVQTVPPKMLSLFNTAMNFLNDILGATVILCSATQPEFGEIHHALKPCENIVSTEKLKKYEFVFKRNRIIDRGQVSIEKIPQIVTELMQKYRSVLVVCNKKTQAAFIFDQIDYTGAKVYHLSAGMCMAHRKNVIEEIKNSLDKKEKVVCVSTQVIEAGVDISFESVIRFCAGIDNIVQAAGRCNRHGEFKDDAPVYIVNCQNENLQMLKEIKEAKEASESLLAEYNRHPEKFKNDIASDEAISWYYNKLYSSKNDEYFDYKTNRNPSIFSLLSLNTEYAGNLADRYYMKQAFKKAGMLFRVFDEEQKSIIVPWKDGSVIIKALYEAGENITRDLLNKARPYSVSVFSFQFKKLFDAEAVTSICDNSVFILNEKYYNEKIGVIDDLEGGNVCDILIL